MRIALSLAAIACVATAQVPAPQPPPSVRAHGQATVTAKPDRVRVEIGVVTQGSTAAAAAQANATQFEAVVAALKKLLGSEAEIQTANYSVNPEYKYPREGGRPTIAGFTASNTIRVETSKVDQASSILDTASGKGANTIHGIHFFVKDDNALRTRALREAAADARRNAEAMAAGVGQKILRILRIEDNAVSTPRPMQKEVMMMRGAVADASAPTPVESGTVEVHATVALTAEIGS